MQKKNCVLCISIGIIVCILLSACSDNQTLMPNPTFKVLLMHTIMGKYGLCESVRNLGKRCQERNRRGF